MLFWMSTYFALVEQVAMALKTPTVSADTSVMRERYKPVYRNKGTPPKKGGGLVLLLQNYPHLLSLRGRGPYHFPTPLNT